MNDRSSGNSNGQRQGGQRKRKSNRGGDNKSNGKGASSSGQKRSRSRNRSRSKKVDPAKYWGTVSMLPDLDEHVISTPDPGTVVNSLGRPPIPGHENASKHYFNLVYDRASSLAVALAAAGGLSDFGPATDAEKESVRDGAASASSQSHPVDNEDDENSDGDDDDDTANRAD